MQSSFGTHAKQIKMAKMAHSVSIRRIQDRQAPAAPTGDFSAETRIVPASSHGPTVDVLNVKIKEETTRARWIQRLQRQAKSSYTQDVANTLCQFDSGIGQADVREVVKSHLLTEVQSEDLISLPCAGMKMIEVVNGRMAENVAKAVAWSWSIKNPNKHRAKQMPGKEPNLTLGASLQEMWRRAHRPIM